MFHLKLSLWVHGFSFVPFSQAYPFLCLLATAILDSLFFVFCFFFCFNYLTGTIKDRNVVDSQQAVEKGIKEFHESGNKDTEKHFAYFCLCGHGML